MKKFSILRILSIFTIAAAGLFGVATVQSSKKAEVTEAATVYKSRSVFEIIDETNATRDAGGNPIMHMWNISVVPAMEYNSAALLSDMSDAGCLNDFEDFNGQWRTINTSDSYIETSFTWEKEKNGKRYWNLRLPWYVVSFDFMVRCGGMYSNTSNYVSAVGCYNIYLFAQSGSNGWYSQSLTSYSGSNSIEVTNYTITAACSGGVSGDGHTAQVKGNGGSYVTSGNYFPRQKISLKATAGTYSPFDHWNYGNDTTASTTFDYVGTAAKTYTATFSDTRSKYTVTFKDYDGTTLETQTNVYQGSSVTYGGGTPTRADEGGAQYTFSKWVDSSGNDKTSALADLQSNLTVYAKYTVTYKTGRYIAGTFPAGTADDWAVSGGVYMTGTGTAGEYSGTVTLAFGDLVKIPYYNGSSFEYNLAYDSYDSLIYTANAYYCFGSNGGSNHEIKCYAAGSYTFYFKDSAYDGSHKISVAYNGSLTAQHLAAKLMNFTEYAGHCGDNDRFPAMRTIYLGLSSSEKTTFQGYESSSETQFKNAYNRYTSWARALGEDPWSNAKVNSSLSLIGLTNEKTNNIAILVVISIVSVTSIGGYFFLRKRKENN